MKGAGRNHEYGIGVPLNLEPAIASRAGARSRWNTTYKNQPTTHVATQAEQDCHPQIIAQIIAPVIVPRR
jgi:hypothetical protein